MRTLLRTTVKNNDTIFVKETVSALNILLSTKGNYVCVTRRRYNNQKIILSERKVILKKSTINMVDRVL